jgi:hypothetical protein
MRKSWLIMVEDGMKNRRKMLALLIQERKQLWAKY